MVDGGVEQGDRETSVGWKGVCSSFSLGVRAEATPARYSIATTAGANTASIVSLTLLPIPLHSFSMLTATSYSFVITPTF